MPIVTATRISQAPPDQILEGNQESRRAEFSFSDPRLAGPVIVRRLAKVATPPAVRFYPEIIADTTVAQWGITVYQGNRELLRFDGSSEPGSLIQRRMWSLTDLRVNRDFTSIGYRLDVRDITGQTAEAKGSFKVTERHRVRPVDSTRLELHEYSLVGFDYNSAELLPRHFAQLEALAKTLTAGSEIRIVGYTDKLGDPDRNRQLSLQRAEVVRDAFTRIKARTKGGAGSTIVVQGLGQQDQVFDNDLPEGRILSRRVRITVSSAALP
jgi:outer membrane protein OmpA-like peptidoglycan-associated protein